MNKLETGIYSVFWNELLKRVDATNRSLQHAILDLNSAVVSLASLKTCISSKRDSFEEYEVEGKGLSGSEDYLLTQTRQKFRKVRLKPLYYGHAEETQLGPSARFREEHFLPVIDQFIASLEHHMQAYKDISDRFSFFRCLSKLSLTETETAAETLAKPYPSDLDDSFPDELCQFTEFAKIFADEIPDGIST